MKAFITDDKREQEITVEYAGNIHKGRYKRTLVIDVDDEAAEVIRFFVDTLMGGEAPKPEKSTHEMLMGIVEEYERERTRPMTTDQGNEPRA